MIVGKISFCPIEVRLGEVEGGGFRASAGGGDREGTGVGEGVEQAHSRGHAAADLGAVVALVKEDALGISGVE